MEKCPRWEICSAPICPLDPLQDRRVDRRDKWPDEPQCQARMWTRYQIAKDSNLPRKGLTKQECAQIKQSKEMGGHKYDKYRV